MEDHTPDPPTSFLQLPFELRNIIYELLIGEAVVETSPQFSGLPKWKSAAFSRGHKFDLQISTKRATYPNLRLPSNLIYTCHQIYAELGSLIWSNIHHLKLTGDFMMGLSSTQPIFDILARRPWIAKSIRVVNVELTLNHVLPVLGGVAVNTAVLGQHPWLKERLRTAELRVQKFVMEDFGVKWSPSGWWHVFRPNWGLHWGRETIGMKTQVEEHNTKAEKGREYNTLPDLAKLLNGFPLLEKINLEAEHCYLLSLFPPPRDTAESFQALNERGVEVNVLVRYWQMPAFCNMLYRNGVERGTIGFGEEEGARNETTLYQTLPEVRRGHRLVSFRLLDCVPRPELEMNEAIVVVPELSQWKKFKKMWVSRIKIP